MSFCPSKRPIVDALSYVKAITKMHNGINRARIECMKERSIEEIFEVVMENLRTFSDAEVCVCDNCNSIIFRRGHTFEGNSRHHYNPKRPQFQPVHQQCSPFHEELGERWELLSVVEFSCRLK